MSYLSEHDLTCSRSHAYFLCDKVNRICGSARVMVYLPRSGLNLASSLFKRNFIEL